MATIYIETFRGFCNASHLFSKGRVLRNYTPVLNNGHSLRKTLWNNIRKLYSKKVRNHPVTFKVGNTEHSTQTDSQAYYRFETDISPFKPNEHTRWEKAYIHCISNETYTTDILIPGKSARYGIISDIYDTILITYVHSKLKMLYQSLFKNPWQRLSPDYASEWINALSENLTQPVFYISNSPWNFYEGISLFLEHYQFPKGPVLLRDFGFYLFKKPYAFTHHKKIQIERLFQYYPSMSFILIGDAVERDPFIYFEILRKFPGQVKHIYIKETQIKRRMRPLLKRKDILNHPKFTLISSYENALVHNLH